MVVLACRVGLVGELQKRKVPACPALQPGRYNHLNLNFWLRRLHPAMSNNVEKSQLFFPTRLVKRSVVLSMRLGDARRQLKKGKWRRILIDGRPRIRLEKKEKAYKDQ